MILINGNFLCRTLTGIERFALEVLPKLDAIVKKEDQIALCVPANAAFVPHFENIEVILSKHKIKSFPVWDLLVFARECKRRKAVALDFANTAPLGKICGIAYIHDVYAADCAKDFTTFRDKLVAIYSRFCYANIAHNAKTIITMSEFTKGRIVELYKVDPKRIAVTGSAWDYYKRIEADEGVFSRFPSVERGGYYFVLGSVSKRKNLAWVARYAQKHPESRFVISGKAIGGVVPRELEALKTMSNVTLTGYLSDDEVKALMQSCKALVFPSYYEGFGLPPLEALSCGAKVVCSTAASIPEICEGAVNYIDPFDTDCDLDAITRKPVSAPDEVLGKYTYQQAAAKLKRILLE